MSGPVVEHKRVRADWWVDECSCGYKDRNLTGHIAEHAELRRQQQRQWFRDTGHCGVCGQPGVFCLCRKPCACADLHQCGSGLVADAVDVFAETPMIDGQTELFG